MATITREQLEAAFLVAWCAQTSASDQWSPDTPARGHCAVSACVAHDYFGGEILNTIVVLPGGATESHYFNAVDGQVDDYTHAQPPPGTVIPPGADKTGVFRTTKEYVLSCSTTLGRYRLLKTRVEAALAAPTAS